MRGAGADIYTPSSLADLDLLVREAAICREALNLDLGEGAIHEPAPAVTSLWGPFVISQDSEEIVCHGRNGCQSDVEFGTSVYVICFQ